MLNWVMIILSDSSYPALCNHLAAIQILSFSTFVMHNVEVYQTHTDPALLIIGFTSVSFLSASFCSINWEITAVYQSFATLIINVYFFNQFGYEKKKLIPTLVLLMFSCASISLNLEYKDKKEFIELKKFENL